MKVESRQGKSILILSGIRIFPVIMGCHVRTGGIARALARLGHRVKIFSLAGRREDYRFFGAGGSSRVVQIEPNLTEEIHLGLAIGLLQTIGRRLDRPRTWQYRMLQRGIIPARLKRLLRESDIIICDMPWTPPVPGPWSSKPWFLISHNLEHRLLEQFSAHHRRVAPWMREVEAQAPRRFRDIFACAEQDRDFFRQHDPAERLSLPIIRCGVDPAAYEVAPGTRARVRAELGLTEQDHLLVFSASRYPPNSDAAEALRKFCQEEAAFLAQHHVSILVLGSVLPGPQREGAFIATGRVPEVAPYLAAADAGVNAVTWGSGSNVKLFEYLAARLPVISTEFGARGTGLEAGRDYLPYEAPRLSSAIERFLGGGTHEHWRAHAELVWLRHRRGCDIQLLVADAVAPLREFQTDSAVDQRALA
ncbi:MAG TPA: glycosyltransferase [Candidatus Margulisiibacteriota bacterium]|nr:glycosyltransferase [Candidatus Margulisiibacteriota bacterium]